MPELRPRARCIEGLYLGMASLKIPGAIRTGSRRTDGQNQGSRRLPIRVFGKKRGKVPGMKFQLRTLQMKFHSLIRAP